MTQTIGNNSNNNTQIMNITSVNEPILIPTDIFKLLKTVENFSSKREEFSMKTPINIKKKLQFNNSRKYIKIFSEKIQNYFMLDEVLKNGFPQSQRVVENVKRIFMDFAEYDEEGEFRVGDGDKCLDSMLNEIKDKIIRDPEFAISNINDQTLDEFILALLQYSVIECQILINPNREGGNL